MRIAIVTAYPPSKSSLNEYAFHFIRFLKTKVENVSEIVLLVDELPEGQEYSQEQEPGQVPMRSVPCWKFNAMNNVSRIRKAVREADPDIVLFNIQFASFGDKKVPATLGLLTPWTLKRDGHKVVVLLHNIMETVNLKSAGFGSNPVLEAVIRLFGNIVTRFILTADWVAVTIPKYVEILEKNYGAKNVLLAPHGSFEEPTNTEPSTLPGGNPTVMTFGKFGTYKTVDLLVEAHAELLKKHPDMRLVIAGTDSPNSAGYLQGVRNKYAQVPNVEYTGYVAEEDVPRIFGEAWVVAFPYTSTTGSSGVLHQAGGYGKAVVLPNLGDFAELVLEEGYDAEFFEPTSAASLAASIAKVIDNPERQKEIGLRNYTAANGLPITEVVDWYLIHFEELLKK
ncbi:MAG: glycosyltransferase [Anaerolineales bacterium]|jgi:glycosyltransferase involved in cell wall biosynthesis|uniref:glycosyltransferase n=1 Tax=Candidatus Villigracilis vicinus TaxID=3140679 RepID=UPI0031348C4B|nr:glycosyltransferase [Anaerolineales bacterium]MBK9782686.1 glycosyltransferase [Anaerolineales bacterium]